MSDFAFAPRPMADRLGPDPLPPTDDGARSPRRGPVWLKRFGVAGFLFFLAKGLLWLALPALLVVVGDGC